MFCSRGLSCDPRATRHQGRHRQKTAHAHSSNAPPVARILDPTPADSGVRQTACENRGVGRHRGRQATNSERNGRTTRHHLTQGLIDRHGVLLPRHGDRQGPISFTSVGTPTPPSMPRPTSPQKQNLPRHQAGQVPVFSSSVVVRVDRDKSTLLAAILAAIVGPVRTMCRVARPVLLLSPESRRSVSRPATLPVA